MDRILSTIAQFSSKDEERMRGVTVDVLPGDVDVCFILFSKDRPFQLCQLLESMQRYVVPAPKMTVVIYTASNELDLSRYERVLSKYNVKGVLENEKLLFFDALKYGVGLIKETVNKNGIVCFCVDDLIYVSDINVKLYGEILIQDISLFGFHLKLHPGIIYSHSSSKCSFPPTLSSKVYRRNRYLSYSLSQAKGEWRYPFDLCSSLYRLINIESLLNEMTLLGGKKLVTTPNIFEVLGNECFWEKASTLFNVYYRCSGCLSKYILSVITVNRVQTEYQVPIYDNDGGDIEKLNNLISDNVNETIPFFNFEKYKNSLYSTVHIGNLYFDVDCKPVMYREVSPIYVTVIIPIFNGEKYIKSCLDSLILNDQGCNFKVMLIDDGSTDNSVSVIKDYIEKHLIFAVNKVLLEYRNLEHSGLVQALEIGLTESNTKYCARLDIDDKCEEYRLLRQVTFMEYNSEINILGTQAILYNDISNTYIAMGIPIDPIIIQWTMFFRCCLLHPTVIFRRHVILECGGYKAAKYDYIEDYDLWIRVLSKYPLSVANLPDSLVTINRHDDSKSKIELDDNRKQSLELKLNQFLHFLNMDENFSEHVMTILDKNSVNTIEHTKTSLLILEIFHKKFLTLYNTENDMRIHDIIMHYIANIKTRIVNDISVMYNAEIMRENFGSIMYKANKSNEIATLKHLLTSIHD